MRYAHSADDRTSLSCVWPTKKGGQLAKPGAVVTALEWTLLGGLAAIYFTLIFTVAVVTYQKRHIALFVIGFVFPFCWLIGAMMAPKPGSGYHGPMA